MDEVTLRTATTADVAELIAFWAYAGENDGRPTDRPDLVAALLDRDPTRSSWPRRTAGSSAR